MNTKERLYADWVECAWEYSVAVGKEENYPMACVQNCPRAVAGETAEGIKDFDIAILGIAPHESGCYDPNEQLKSRFFSSNNPRQWPFPWPRAIADIDHAFGKVEDIYFSNILFWGDHVKIDTQYKTKCYELAADLMDKVLRPRIVICCSIPFVFKPLQQALGNIHWKNIRNQIVRPTGERIYNNVAKCAVNGITYYGIPDLTGTRWRNGDRRLILDFIGEEYNKGAITDKTGTNNNKIS